MGVLVAGTVGGIAVGVSVNVGSTEGEGLGVTVTERFDTAIVGVSVGC